VFCDPTRNTSHIFKVHAFGSMYVILIWPAYSAVASFCTMWLWLCYSIKIQFRECYHHHYFFFLLCWFYKFISFQIVPRTATNCVAVIFSLVGCKHAIPCRLTSLFNLWTLCLNSLSIPCHHRTLKKCLVIDWFWQ
jgi:hypothetical protein